METVKEKLVRILDDYWEVTMTVEDVADVLIGNGVTMQEWVSVDERSPNEEELELSPFHLFVVCCNGEVYDAVYTGAYFARRGMRLYGVTHWMPLPQPPKGVQ